MEEEQRHETQHELRVVRVMRLACVMLLLMRLFSPVDVLLLQTCSSIAAAEESKQANESIERVALQLLAPCACLSELRSPSPLSLFVPASLSILLSHLFRRFVLLCEVEGG